MASARTPLAPLSPLAMRSIWLRWAPTAAAKAATDRPPFVKYVARAVEVSMHGIMSSIDYRVKGQRRPMTTQDPLACRHMGTKADIDIKVRRRIAAHLRRVREESEFPSNAAMVSAAGVSRSAMNRALKGERTVGLDFLLALHAHLELSIDMLVDQDPAAKWFVEQEPRAGKRKR